MIITAMSERMIVNLPGPIDTANSMSDKEFVETYFLSSGNWQSWIHPHTKARYQLSFVGVQNMTSQDLEDCLSLIAYTSKSDYQSSERGWRPRAKMYEMRSPEMRYIIVRRADVNEASASGAINAVTSGRNKVVGFTSMMPTYENGEAVLYCYEIHLSDELRSTGLGRLLMSYHEIVARNIPSIIKVMLTCFACNQVGRQFYSKLGYEKDPFSPEPRTLRGKTVGPSYLILSKHVKDDIRA